MVQRIRHLVAKVLMLLLAVCMVFGAAFLFAGCSDDGKSVQSFAIKNGELIVTYTDGTTDNLGSVVGSNGTQGDQGPQGPQGEQGDKGDKGDQGEPGRGIEKVEIVDGNLMVTYTDSDTPVNVGKVDEADAIAVADIKTEVVDGTTYIVITYTDPEKEATRIPVDSLLPTCEHDFYEITLTEATCAQGGVVLSVCQNDCGTALIDFTDPNPDNHTYVDTLTMPTCEADGFITRTCTNGDSTVTVTLAEIVADAEGDGIYSELLAENEITDPANQLKATGHNYQYDFVEPTCEEPGYITYVCENNEEETGTITLAQIQEDPDTYAAILANLDITVEDMAATGHSGEADGRWITVVDEGANICVDGGQRLLVCSYCMEHVYKAEAIEAEGHVVTAEWKVTVEPTLEEKGEITGPCSVCGLSAATVELPALNATDYSYSVSKPATCTETGIDVYTKTIGGLDVRFEVVTSAAHNVGGVSMPLDKVYSQQEMEALGEKGGISGNYPATCLDDSGLGYFYCDECGELYIVHVSGPHTYTEEDLVDEKAPTCYEAGWKDYVCSVCGETVRIPQPMVAHTYGAPVVTPIYGEGDQSEVMIGATIVFTCSVCPEGTDGHTYTINAITWVESEDPEETFDATCKAPGQITYNYTYYKNPDNPEEGTESAQYVQILPQLPHTSVNGGTYVVGEDEDTVYLWTKVDEVSGNYPADCTTIGQGILRCEDCKTVFIVPVTGAHTYGEGVLTKPTCEDPGYITYTCTKDAAHKLVIDQAALEKAQTEDAEAYEEYMAILEKAGLDSLKALGHVYTAEPVIDIDTETMSGTITFTCDRCGEKWVVEGKNFQKDNDQSVASTCETAGYDYYTYEYDLPEGGTESDFIKVPLPLASHKNKKNTVYDPAKQVYLASEVDEVAGNYPADCLTKGQGTIKCATCETVFIVTVQGDHTYTTVEWLTKEATCTEGGYQYKHCSVCDKDIIKANSATDALGHSYTYNVTTAATTTTAGVLTGTCSVCQSTVTYDLPAISTENGYTLVTTVQATCQSDGYYEYQYVVKNGEEEIYTYTVRVTIPAVDHNLEQGHVYTWEFNGYTYTGTYCNLCGQIIVTNKTPIETETPEVGA